MAAIKISSKVDEKVWGDLKALAEESHQNVSGLLTEAIAEYVQRRRVRPAVLKHLEDSIERNEMLGKLLAR
jgi:predicted transcriptional regulator